MTATTASFRAAADQHRADAIAHAELIRAARAQAIAEAHETARALAGHIERIDLIDPGSGDIAREVRDGGGWHRVLELGEEHVRVITRWGDVKWLRIDTLTGTRS